MVTAQHLRRIARGRLKDAEVLLSARRYDGAVYLIGYAVEIGLKARICKTLKWAGYPSTAAEFKDYRSFQTHDLDVLLNLSGAEHKVKARYMVEWSVVATWDPNTRYRPIGSAKAQDARDMVVSAETLLRILW